MVLITTGILLRFNRTSLTVGPPGHARPEILFPVCYSNLHHRDAKVVEKLARCLCTGERLTSKAMEGRVNNTRLRRALVSEGPRGTTGVERGGPNRDS